MPTPDIIVENARQNNLQGQHITIPSGTLTVVTGVSGSGKSSLAFDTIYAEGLRRYLETFSTYARQFLQKLDAPDVGFIHNIPPAIYIGRTGPVRSSRSTVGTMTGLTDHIKLLFSGWATLHCRSCGQSIQAASPENVVEQISTLLVQGTTLLICFPISVPASFTAGEITDALEKQGFTRVVIDQCITEISELPDELPAELNVLVDRIRLNKNQRSRCVEAVELAYSYGQGTAILSLSGRGKKSGASMDIPFRYSNKLNCPDCDISYSLPSQNLFSFNDPIGACPVCHGFGRLIEIDPDLVIPDKRMSLEDGAIKPWRSGFSRECMLDLEHFCCHEGIPMNVPFHSLAPEHSKAIMEGADIFYGIKGYFDWLESRTYKMHYRVLLSRYRTYRTCPSCRGTRFRDETLLYRFKGKTIADIYAMTVEKANRFISGILENKYEKPLPARHTQTPGTSPLALPDRAASRILLSEVLSRLGYLRRVGLDYLRLDRQSRTLSGGESERVALTAALGTKLVNTLYILDEPSSGLHPRDTAQLRDVLNELKNRGNTVLLVEHDMELISSADHVIDLGPGPGPHGGRVVYAGPLQGLKDQEDSVTGAYLSGSRQVSTPVLSHRRKTQDQLCLTVKSPSVHNLKGEDIIIPLHKAVCITGVSGSGKSSLMIDVIYSALSRRFKGGQAIAANNGGHIEGCDNIADVVLVDQTPVGRTPRANPATYMKILDPLRAIFAATPSSIAKGYSKSHFSFNAQAGKCPACKGAGYERIEMQFLPDILLQCPVCRGKRLKQEVLEITVRGRNIAEILKFSVEETADFFSDVPAVVKRCQPLITVGLGYLTLDQPLPTLSGGEIQRLKLARSLGYRPRGQNRAKKKNPGTLFLFDEPTIGLHPHDISAFLLSLDKLIENGHSVLVIEHHLDVMTWADHIIDLGPEGGDGGGYVVTCGTPEKVAASRFSWTGIYLNRHLKRHLEHIRRGETIEMPGEEEDPAHPLPAHSLKNRWDHVTEPSVSTIPTARMVIKGAAEHNLKRIDVCIPQDKLVVITGVSGSGKSSLAFDILFSEGRRRYMESLPLYVRRYVEDLDRPRVDSVTGIPPTVAIEQRVARASGNSTVGTITEIYHYLRLLFSRAGKQTCRDCNLDAVSTNPQDITKHLLSQIKQRETVILVAPLVSSRKGYHRQLAEWARKKGYSTLIVDGKETAVQDFSRLDRHSIHTIDLPVGKITAGPKGFSTSSFASKNEKTEVTTALPDETALVVEALTSGAGTAAAVFQNKTRIILSSRICCPGCGQGFAPLDPRFFSFSSTLGACPSCQGAGIRDTGELCHHCQGTRLKPEALAVLFRGKTIDDITAMTVKQARAFFSSNIVDKVGSVAEILVPKINSRLIFLEEVGLPYLELKRRAETLSTGETQRVKLAAQLGSNLNGVCYVLDEPTVGLHPRDSAQLIEKLRTLRDQGNSIVVVEHDEATIRAADHIIDLGPGAGVSGGAVVAEGTIQEIEHNPDSITGRFLCATTRQLQTPTERKQVGKKSPLLVLTGARKNNLKNVQVAIPIGYFTCVTGVSGAGKSTLIREVLLPALIAKSKGKELDANLCDQLDGWSGIRRVGEVDQSPIGRTPRSVPATYMNVFNDIRSLFACLPESRARGYSSSRFSFNTPQGRCFECSGLGIIRVEMSFLPDVYSVCRTCRGKRYDRETLEVAFKGCTIADVLEMTVSESLDLFKHFPRIAHRLKILEDLGLDYLHLGQASPTLSGGEAQRIKLATELSSTSRSGPALLILEEPTTGLHAADVQKLNRVLRQLADRGNTVIVIEHNLDVITEADYIIDLGPEGGDAGGTVVACGTPRELTRNALETSYTARFLAKNQPLSGPIA